KACRRLRRRSHRPIEAPCRCAASATSACHPRSTPRGIPLRYSCLRAHVISLKPCLDRNSHLRGEYTRPKKGFVVLCRVAAVRSAAVISGGDQTNGTRQRRVINRRDIVDARSLREVVAQ